VNLSSGEETSIRELVEILSEVTGFKGRVVWDAGQPEGQQRRRFDVSKARRDLGFAPRVTLREGLRRTVQWYRSQRPSPAGQGALGGVSR
jgi:GDP-L-fucose synthase